MDLEWALSPTTGVLTRTGEDAGRCMHGGKPCEAERGVTLPQAREHLGPPEVGRGKEGSFSRTFEGIIAPLIP